MRACLPSSWSGKIPKIPRLPGHTSFADPVTQRLDIEFMFQAMEDFVADRAVITKRDQGKPLCRQRLMAQPSEGFACLNRTVWIHGVGTREALELASVIHTQAIEVLPHERLLAG